MTGSATLFGALIKFYEEYNQKTPQKTKLIDAYLMYIMFTGIIQFGYCLLVGTFPFNSFLSGFISSVGSFVLAGKWKNMRSANAMYDFCFYPPSPVLPPMNKVHFTCLQMANVFVCKQG